MVPMQEESNPAVTPIKEPNPLTNPVVSLLTSAASDAEDCNCLGSKYTMYKTLSLE